MERSGEWRKMYFIALLYQKMRAWAHMYINMKFWLIEDIWTCEITWYTYPLQVQFFRKPRSFEKRQQFYLTLSRWPKLSDYLYGIHATVFHQVVYGRFTVTIFVTNMSKLNHWLGGIWYDMICISSDAETNIQSNQKSPIIYQHGPQKAKACLPIIISQEPLR